MFCTVGKKILKTLRQAFENGEDPESQQKPEHESCLLPLTEEYRTHCHFEHQEDVVVKIVS